MAEVILSPLLDVIKRNLSSAAIEELRLVWGVDEELNNLEGTLSAIHAVLEDAEDMQSESKAVKDWLEKLQDVADDADDLVDDMAVEAQQSIMESETGYGLMKMMQQVCNFLPSCFGRSTQVYYRWGMARRIKRINEQLNKIAKEKADFHFQASPARKQFETREGPRQLVGSVKDESEIFGRQEEKDRIIESLLSDDSSNRRKFSVIAITGMGGQGKTTLAQLVYNDQAVISKFELRAWVCVSEDFDVTRLTKEIIESASGSSCDLSSIDALQRSLHQILNGKKFFLVLDDVWNEDPDCWDKLQGPFAFGEKGSKIVVTTRSRAVSDVMQPKRTHSLEGLSKEDCWALFRSQAFADDDEEHVDADYPRLVEIGRKLVDECQGLPLAVKALGGLLFSTRDETEWENVLKSKTWELDTEGGKILAALRLSYRHLPAHLKRCFTFCSVYPKDHKFDQQQLVKMWIALGLVRGKDGQQIEDTGSRYFNYLVQRSFFQYSVSDKRYMMHDLFHDLAQSIAGNECFNASDSKQRQDIPKKARHLSLKSYLIRSVNVERIYELRGLRTLFFQGNLNWTNEMFNSLKFLRVLQLYGCDVPDSIGSLRHLRYLEFQNDTIKELPESICNIYNLQILILDGCYGLVKLPNGTSKLSNLRHLQFYYYYLESMPPGIGRLTSLQTLSAFVVGREEERGIEGLKNLKDLRGALTIAKLEHVQNAEAAHQADLGSKSYINGLTLKWSHREAVSSIDERLEEKVAEGLQPHPNVKELYFQGFMGTRFPSWMMKSGMDMLLPNLTHVHLYKCRRCSILPPLGQLPSLVELSIYAMDEVKRIAEGQFFGLRRLDICNCPQLATLSRFPSLEQLYLENLNNLNDWCDAGEEEFENLRNLQVDNCPNLTKWPTKLSALSELRVSNCSGFDSVPLIPSLRSLTIDNCSQLTSLPCLPSLEQLYLSNLDNLDDWFGADEDEFGNLRELVCQNCPKLTKWPTKLSALSELRVSNCSGFDSVPLIPSLRSLCIMRGNEKLLNSVSSLTSLSSLSLRDLKLMAMPGGILKALTQLKSLDIRRCEQLETFLDMDDVPPNLTTLRFYYCVHLKSLPKGLHALTSLQRLEISHCQVQALPEEGLPTGLQTLSIVGCPTLRERCRKDTGEDWPKISHVRYLHLDDLTCTDYV